MTTTVKVEAHCNNDTRVEVVTMDGDEVVDSLILADGDKTEVYAHDERSVRVREVKVE